MKSIHKLNIYHYMIISVLVWLLIQLIYLLFTKFERVIVVKSKEGYGARHGSRDQLVTDESGQVYIVSNALLLLHFTSAELFNNLEVGKRYTIKGYGLRIPVLGMFPNITSASKL